MTLRDIVERLEEMERRKMADYYGFGFNLIDDIKRLKRDIEDALILHGGGTQ